MQTKRLAIVVTHPIQYHAPLFKLLSTHESLNLKVFYTLGVSSAEVTDKGFGKAINWDIPLLDGYAYKFLKNVSKEPGTSHFKGIVNPTIIEDIRDYQPTDILVFGWNFDSHLKVLKYFKNKVTVYFRGDSTLLDESKGLKVLLRRLVLKWVYRNVDKAFFVGTNNKQYFLKHGFSERDLVFAPHAIDNERFGNDEDNIIAAKLIREDLGIPEIDIVFLFTGKFEYKKNPLLLIKAFKRMAKSNVHLLLVGNGKLEEELKQEAKGWPTIHFLPFQNQSKMPATYRAADVLVLPSAGPGETWGLCINEAMACGRPIIASNKVGCAVDLVQGKRNGFIFDSGNIEDLTSCLTLLASLPKEELRRMGNASKIIIKKWSYEQIKDAIVTTLK
ncbi:glycosyltransferase family 4 protein [Pontibacter beigongshangensis]|uniref:glycosyltransferase family 4 protein n=1 Tax=Pontibacter beigongshangensis TaxID=2574733 RepID=UPI00164F9B85|nr:glycosyltransferase family 4 protein [Pontibacter beigongshangensis]